MRYKILTSSRPKKARNGTGAEGGLLQSLSDKISQMFPLLTSLCTLGMSCGILDKTHVANCHSAFGQLCWFSGKCVFDPKVLKQPTQNTPQKGPVFGGSSRILMY